MPLSKQHRPVEEGPVLLGAEHGDVLMGRHLGHAVMEVRCGLECSAHVNLACGRGEREAVLAIPGKLVCCLRRILAADKAYNTANLVAACRDRGVIPQVTQNTRGRRSAIDGRTTRHAGYGLCMKIRAGIDKLTMAGSRPRRGSVR